MIGRIKIFLSPLTKLLLKSFLHQRRITNQLLGTVFAITSSNHMFFIFPQVIDMTEHSLKNTEDNIIYDITTS